MPSRWTIVKAAEREQKEVRVAFGLAVARPPTDDQAAKKGSYHGQQWQCLGISAGSIHHVM